ncbi:MAG: aminopeptidase P family protein [Alphaproteobacteria bacterium]|nr:aminopeptidase P family protein [Alphaproteobacteria bacterium]
MSDIDRDRAARLIRLADFDAIVMAKPESYVWATGAPSGVSAQFRRAGAALALLPSDATAPLGAVVSELFAGPSRAALGEAHVLTHPDWVETADIRAWAKSNLAAAELFERHHRELGRAPRFERPATFDAAMAFGQLGALLRARGLAKGRIGLDLDYWPATDFQKLAEVLPDIAWVDASVTIEAIKAVKSPVERRKLREAAALAEAGMRAAIRRAGEGVHRDEIAEAWRVGAAEEASRQGLRPTGMWEYTTVGALPWTGGGKLARGDVLKFDVGCLIDGYSSDSGRTFVLGAPDHRARDIMAALGEAFAAGLEALKPGRRLGEVHARATAAMHLAGFTSFSRGHFGHSLGRDTFCEVAPFIAKNSETVIEPGMVLAFETPLYVDGIGGFIIEDQFEITATEALPAWSLERGLVSL